MNKQLGYINVEIRGTSQVNLIEYQAVMYLNNLIF